MLAPIGFTEGNFQTMFIATPDYKAHIDKIIADSDSVDFAIAFWGKGDMKYLANSGKRFRIL
ncbi:hypothetical protein D3C72_2144740 [compost metagenome]